MNMILVFLNKRLIRFSATGILQIVPPVYYMCDIYVIHVWCFRYIQTPIIHV